MLILALNCRLKVELFNFEDIGGGLLTVALRSLRFLSASHIRFSSFLAAILFMRLYLS